MELRESARDPGLLLCAHTQETSIKFVIIVDIDVYYKYEIYRSKVGGSEEYTNFICANPNSTTYRVCDRINYLCENCKHFVNKRC